MSSALVLLAEGNEEMEVVITIDVLRRAQVEVTVAGLEGAQETICSRGVKIVPEVALKDLKQDFDLLVLPGGLGGTERFCASEEVGQLLRHYQESDRWVGIICAAPLALQAHQCFLNYQLTAHPSVHSQLQSFQVEASQKVVTDRKLITSQGPGTAFDFALTLVEKLTSAELAAKLRGPMILPNH